MNDLKSKAINIKGKQYVQVVDRIKYFNENYETGFISTELLSDPQSSTIVIKASVTPILEQSQRVFTGHAQEVVGDGMINKSSAMENAETSAIGRALGMMGIGMIDSVASADEMNKAISREVKAKKCTKCGKDHHQKMGELCYDCWKEDQNKPF